MTGPKTGRGPLPSVLVPGMLCDAELWTEVEPALPGPVVHAQITAPSIADMAEEVLSSVEGEFVLVGLSLGAIVAFEVARRAPERLAGLCALSTNAQAPRPGQLAGWRQLAERAAAGEFESVLTDRILPTMYAAADPSEPLRERFLGMARRIGPDTFRAQLAAQATRTDAHAAVAALECPVLALCGARDALCPPSFHRDIAQRAAAGSLRVLADAGHLLPLERPGETAASLRRWLTDVVGTPSAATCD
ncbi:alpha/beta hydrolase [Streptomyces tubbatahanensis]|uniref:Alpha/beta hydrolase n=1 Tax=Streptomyces tubbatahanensis TaxID=2923272 RepID=A0ABY3XMC1_9ACTN|nr:alpha/beta hydrolase [Streptomyces tubbatahanensis]UNS95562.1 alpha/beta hydrolase [Streptomyces tubbatahanensis]